MLPFCLALVDMLQAQNPMAALPAALGILSGTHWPMLFWTSSYFHKHAFIHSLHTTFFSLPGHLYYFLRNVWPKMGHREVLLAPEWWVKILNRNNDDAIFRRDKRPLATAEAGGEGGGAGGKLASMLGKKKSKTYKMSGKKAAATTS